MTSGANAVDDIRKWLEQGGYILEMEVAQRLQPYRPDNIEQGYRYTDIVTKKEREGDIRAFFSLHGGFAIDGIFHGLQVLIECKNTTAPWIFFLRSASTIGNGEWVARAHIDDSCTACETMLGALEDFTANAPLAYAVTEKRVKNSTDHAYEAAQQATSAILSSFSAPTGGHESRQESVVAQPLVVTRSPLFTCELSSDGFATLRAVSRVGVLVQRTDLPDPIADGLVVTVTTVEGLDEAVSSLLASLPTAAPSGAFSNPFPDRPRHPAAS